MNIVSTINDDLDFNLLNSKLDLRWVYIDALYDTLSYKTELEEWFDNLEGPMVEDFITDDEIKAINKIIKSGKLYPEKLQLMDAIIKPKGFLRIAMGTNRAVYQPLFDDTFVIKVALDRAGATNNPNEIVNQKYLKPYVCKCFDITSDGNIGTFERVIPIDNPTQFWSVREDIYNIIQKFIRRFVIDDFGTSTFKNWGIRKGFGPVLLDYADMYLLDPDELYCRSSPTLHTVTLCGGRIGYTEGYNRLVCLDCGCIAKASDFKGRKKISVYRPRRKEHTVRFRKIVDDVVVYDSANPESYKTTEKKELELKPEVEEFGKYVKELDKQRFDYEVEELVEGGLTKSKAKEEAKPLRSIKVTRAADIDLSRGTVLEATTVKEFKEVKPEVTKEPRQTSITNNNRRRRVVVRKVTKEVKENVFKPSESVNVEYQTTENKQVKEETNKDNKEKIHIMKNKLMDIKGLIERSFKDFIEENQSGDPFSLIEINKLYKVLLNQPKEKEGNIKLIEYVPDLFLIDYDNKFGISELEINNIEVDVQDYNEVLKPIVDKIFAEVNDRRIELEDDFEPAPFESIVTKADMKDPARKTTKNIY